jgi:hypothetical protein
MEKKKVTRKKTTNKKKSATKKNTAKTGTDAAPAKPVRKKTTTKKKTTKTTSDSASVKPVHKKTTRKKKPATPDLLSNDSREKLITEIAYLHAERNGFSSASPQDDWFFSESIVDKVLQAIAGEK